MTQHENEAKRDKIEDVVSYIEERLGELEEEKQELSEYQVLDKRRKVAEYTYDQKELKKAKTAMAKSRSTSTKTCPCLFWIILAVSNVFLLRGQIP